MWATLLTILLLAGDDPHEDTIKFARGKPIKGIILRHGDKGVWLAQKTRIKYYSLEKITALEGPRISWNEYIKKNREIYSSPPNAENSFNLARWCSEKGLTREVDLHYWQALNADPNHEAANKALGHKKYKGRWRIPVKGKGKISISDTRSYRKKDFSNAWEFTTSHFEIRCAGDLPDTLRLCLDLEMIYQGFFQAFQDPVGFWETREPIKIHIYPNEKSMPKKSGTVQAYFDEETQTVYSFMRDGEAISLTKLASQAILRQTLKEFIRNEPTIPGWLNEGLSTYIETTFSGNPGNRYFDFDLKNTSLIEHQLDHKKQNSIQRILNYQTEDFRASTDQTLKVSESYNLVSFLMQEKSKNDLTSLLIFLKSVYARKSSSTHLKEALDIQNWDQFEREWVNWLKNQT